MSSSAAEKYFFNTTEENLQRRIIFAELRKLANAFLNDHMKANNVLDIVNGFKELLKKQTQPYMSKVVYYKTIGSILTIEVIFKVLLQRRDMHEETLNDPLEYYTAQNASYAAKKENPVGGRGTVKETAQVGKEVKEVMTDVKGAKEVKTDAKGAKEVMTDAKRAEATVRYRLWLRECYEESLELLLNAVGIGYNERITRQAMISYLKLMETESTYQLYAQATTDEHKENNASSSQYVNMNNRSNDNYVHHNEGEVSSFPVIRLKNLLQRLTSGVRRQSSIIYYFRIETAKYVDVVWYSWSLMQTPLLTWRTSLQNETSAKNVLELIDSLPIVLKPIEHTDPHLCCPIVSATATEADKKANSKQMLKFINRVWNNLMTWFDGGRISIRTHKQLLILLLERIMVHLEQPLKLTDFLMNSLDEGGVISVLALQGVYKLMQQHNITYPQLYTKLYNLYTPFVFHMRCKARLYRLTDTFLSSTHLPESLVASFIKRFARLCLFAPPPDIIILSKFIQNLIIRHPKLKRMIGTRSVNNAAAAEANNPNGNGDVIMADDADAVNAPNPPNEAISAQNDPYDWEEIDPIKTDALNSYLWEMGILRNHGISAVATIANQFVNGILPENEWDLSKICQLNVNQMFEAEIANNNNNNPLMIANDNQQPSAQIGMNFERYWDVL